MFRLILIFVFLFVAGCGSSSSTKRTTTSRPAADNSDSYSNSHGDGSVADEARNNTRKRRGEWSLTSGKVKEVTSMVSAASSEYNIPEDLIYGIIWVESRFNPKAVSPVGARGLMQLMPKTADYLADCISWSGRHRSFDPDFNIAAGSYYIARLIRQFDGDEDLALAAYNAGPGNVAKWMKGTGLPKVSIEYATMVQTARGFFGGVANSSSPSQNSGSSSGSVEEITDDDLDRLGLAILIAGLSDKQFGLEREDDANPFD